MLWYQIQIYKLFWPTVRVLLFCYLTTTLAASTERRIALVIGNSDYYSIGSLFNPVNDARAMSRTLTKAGFEVRKYENLGQTAMKQAIAKFGRQLSRYNVGLFYYAGHGVQMKGRNYLIPVDIKIQYESDIEIEAVDLATVLSKMGGSDNRLNLVILDACRDNPFASNARALNQGLAFTNAPSGTLIAYATAPGAVAADGDGDNGVYTSYLIKHMLTPGKQIEDVFKQVRIDVKKETANRQIPWESSSLEGDFYFFPEHSQQRINAPSPSPPPTNISFPNEPYQPNNSHQRNPSNSSHTVTLNCSDLREKEAFSGGMGFGELTQKEVYYLKSNCQ